MENMVANKSIKVKEIIRLLRHDATISIYDKKTTETLFYGNVYQLYDNGKFDNLYINNFDIVADRFSIEIVSEGSQYEYFIKHKK